MASVKGQIDKEGHITSETILAITVASTSGTTITHGLGVIPDTVQIIPTSQYHVWGITASHTATAIVLGSANSGATCDVIVRTGSNPGTITETVS